MRLSAAQWKGLIKSAVVMTAVGAVLTVAGSFKGYTEIMRIGEFVAFCGFLIFLFARIKYTRRMAQGPD